VTPTATVRVAAADGCEIRQIVDLMDRVRNCSPAPALPGYRGLLKRERAAPSRRTAPGTRPTALVKTARPHNIGIIAKSCTSQGLGRQHDDAGSR
jgi:hypothetical protein